MGSDDSHESGRPPAENSSGLPSSARAHREQLLRAVETVRRSPIIGALLDAVDAVLLVLDTERRIVAFNGQAARVREASELLGLRPGEALGCVNSRGPGGCGAAPVCATCGALGAILRAGESGRPAEAECLVRSELGQGMAFEFNVRASPLEMEGCTFTILSLRDVSGQKRREALEQIFLHDLLNTVAGLLHWAETLRRTGTELDRPAERIDLLARRLEREIRDQQTLLSAENGTLVPTPVEVRPAEVIRDLERFASWQAESGSRRLEVDPNVPDVELCSDPALLLRVLVNMVRNALEATPAGGLVRVWCQREPWSGGEADEEAVRFCVRNEGTIPADVQARIFQRSFSTKARRGRGLGTHGMKLLGERYLGGEVSFVSTAESGTVFSIRLPLRPPGFDPSDAGSAGG